MAVAGFAVRRVSQSGCVAGGANRVAVRVSCYVPLRPGSTLRVAGLAGGATPSGPVRITEIAAAAAAAAGGRALEVFSPEASWDAARGELLVTVLGGAGQVPLVEYAFSLVLQVSERDTTAAAGRPVTLRSDGPESGPVAAEAEGTCRRAKQ